MKKWLYSALLAGLVAILLIPLMGFSANAKGKGKLMPNQITLQSGGVGVPLGLAEELFPGLYHSPTDGIIGGVAGGLGLGCVPDVHEFSKSVEGEHIVFTAGVKEFETNDDAAALLEEFTIYVEITSNGHKVAELPFNYHADPATGDGVDPNTGKPFWVSALYFTDPGYPTNVIDLPTGEYEYKFKAKANSKNNKGHVLDVWVPKNHKFTILN
jgi:hypothetical protein